MLRKYIIPRFQMYWLVYSCYTADISFFVFVYAVCLFFWKKFLGQSLPGQKLCLVSQMFLYYNFNDNSYSFFCTGINWKQC